MKKNKTEAIVFGIAGLLFLENARRSSEVSDGALWAVGAIMLLVSGWMAYRRKSG